MSTASEFLAHLQQEGLSLHERQMRHATQVLRERLLEAMEAEDPGWLEFADSLLEAGRTGDWGPIEALILEGYRRVLFERAPGDQTAADPSRSDEEWDKLPDFFAEIAKRGKIGA